MTQETFKITLGLIQTLITILWIIMFVKHNRKVRFLEQKILENVGTVNSNFKTHRVVINETRQVLNDLRNDFEKFVKEQEKINDENSAFEDSVCYFSEAVYDTLSKVEERLNSQGKTIQSIHNKTVTLDAKQKTTDKSIDKNIRLYFTSIENRIIESFKSCFKHIEAIDKKSANSFLKIGKVLEVSKEQDLKLDKELNLTFTSETLAPKKEKTKRKYTKKQKHESN